MFADEKGNERERESMCACVMTSIESHVDLYEEICVRMSLLTNLHSWYMDMYINYIYLYIKKKIYIPNRTQILSLAFD